MTWCQRAPYAPRLQLELISIHDGEYGKWSGRRQERTLNLSTMRTAVGERTFGELLEEMLLRLPSQSVTGHQRVVCNFHKPEQVVHILVTITPSHSKLIT